MVSSCMIFCFSFLLPPLIYSPSHLRIQEQFFLEALVTKPASFSHVGLLSHLHLFWEKFAFCHNLSEENVKSRLNVKCQCKDMSSRSPNTKPPNASLVSFTVVSPQAFLASITRGYCHSKFTQVGKKKEEVLAS